MIRVAKPEDAELLPALQRASVLAQCASVYSAVQLAEWAASFVPDSYRIMMDTRQMLVDEVEDGGGRVLRAFGVIDARHARINALYVAPVVAGKGVGRALLAALEAAPGASGVGELRLSATLNAVGFYEAHGYERCGATTHRLASGAELACESMRKVLGFGR